MVLSGARGVSPRDEWDPGLFEDDSLSLLDHPFSVPTYLQQQVASFEEQYNRSRTQYNNVLVNDCEPPIETLYQYFAQILEEHGPLSAEDPLLVGELKNFPPLAQHQVQAAGGLEDFVFQSNRFIKIGGCIGLAQQAVVEPPAGGSLDDLDLIDFTTPESCLYSDFRETYPNLPNPYVYDLYSDTGLSDPPLSNPVASAAQAPSIVTQSISKPTVGDGKGANNDQPLAEVSTVEKEKHGQGSLRSVAFNTEVNPDYESHQGELNNMVKTNQDIERQMSALAVEWDQHDRLHQERICELEEDLQKITSSVQVTQKELSLFQRKLEEEVKKDQREKKEHQEQLRALRLELEELQQEQERHKRSIREKKDKYEAQLTDFLELSNQSAAERMSQEDEIKRCKDLITKASRRSLTAQLSVLESSREQSLYSLHRELTDNKAMLRRLDELTPRFSHQDLETTHKSLRAGVQEIEKKISSTEKHYEELMEQVKKGSSLSELQTLSTCEGASAQPSEGGGDHVAPPSYPQPPEGVAAAAVKKQHKHSSMFERAVERLTAIFPHLTRSELTGYIQKLRSSSGSLHSLSLHELVSAVTQMILDQQEEQSLAESRAQKTALGNSASVWQSLEPHRNQPVQSKALNTEDPCIICHEDMCAEDMCVLECRHSFHRECIRSWLKEQSTCPTCRDHALLPEDFPQLPGKRHI